MGLLSRWLLGVEADASWAARIRQAIDKCSVAVLRARVREVLSVDVLNLLANIRVPVLYLQASRDGVVPAAALIEIQRVLPGIQVAKIEGPHFLLQARPLPCAEQISMFVERLMLAYDSSNAD
jgi:pimeloyl-ACP methyl ester carboxylesterase